MASNKTLNADNLETLGAARLAELLIEISDGNAMIKRRLRLELAGAQSPAEVAKQIRNAWRRSRGRAHSLIGKIGKRWLTIWT
jgi:hypothetical protein